MSFLSILTIFDPPLPPYQRLIKWGGGRAKDKYLVAPLRRPPPPPPGGGRGGWGAAEGGPKTKSLVGGVQKWSLFQKKPHFDLRTTAIYVYMSDCINFNVREMKKNKNMYTLLYIDEILEK